MNKIIKMGLLSAFTTLMSFQLWAQDKKVDVDIDLNKGNSNWYEQTWIWIVGGAVFLLLLVALLRGGGKKE